MFPRKADLTGTKFGRLTVVSRAESDGYRSRWNCICECGKDTVVHQTQLVTGKTKSCGCFKIDVCREKATTHGQRDSRAFQAWAGIKQRCTNSNYKEHYLYGGRGIYMCDRWKTSFENFIEDMGHPDDGMSIDRIDNDGPYSPENCRWATIKEQANNRRTNVSFMLDGKKFTPATFSEFLGVTREAVYKRMRRGQTPEYIASVFTQAAAEAHSRALIALTESRS